MIDMDIEDSHLLKLRKNYERRHLGGIMTKITKANLVPEAHSLPLNSRWYSRFLGILCRFQD